MTLPDFASLEKMLLARAGSGLQGLTEVVVGIVLPIAVLGAALVVAGRFFNQRLYRYFGWTGVLAFAWIGTPVHELSHLIACWIARHQVRDFALFKPNPKTGGLGYVDHSCDANSFYQRTFGNLLISIAPFIGGALALHFAGGELAPSLLNRVETLPTPGVDNLTTGGAVDYFRALYATGAAFAHEFHARASDPNFRFFFAVYALVSTAAHLAPSKSDFSGAGRPALIVCTVVIAVWFAGALAGPAIAPYFAAAADLARRFEVLLACALLFLLIGAAALFAATVFMRPAENGRK